MQENILLFLGLNSFGGAAVVNKSEVGVRFDLPPECQWSLLGQPLLKKAISWKLHLFTNTGPGELLHFTGQWWNSPWTEEDYLWMKLITWALAGLCCIFGTILFFCVDGEHRIFPVALHVQFSLYFALCFQELLVHWRLQTQGDNMLRKLRVRGVSWGSSEVLTVFSLAVLGLGNTRKSVGAFWRSKTFGFHWEKLLRTVDTQCPGCAHAMQNEGRDCLSGLNCWSIAGVKMLSWVMPADALSSKAFPLAVFYTLESFNCTRFFHSSLSLAFLRSNIFLFLEDSRPAGQASPCLWWASNFQWF